MDWEYLSRWRLSPGSVIGWNGELNGATAGRVWGAQNVQGQLASGFFYVRSLAVMMSPKLPRTIVFPLLIKLRHPLCCNLQELPIILANLALTAGDLW